MFRVVHRHIGEPKLRDFMYLTDAERCAASREEGETTIYDQKTGLLVDKANVGEGRITAPGQVTGPAGGRAKPVDQPQGQQAPPAPPPAPMAPGAVTGSAA
jgi:hypothetical protein